MDSTASPSAGSPTAIGMSKSGLYAHFGSKEDLQLATIASARETFVAEVFVPALDAPQGVRRLYAACDAFLSHIERRVFPRRLLLRGGGRRRRHTVQARYAMRSLLSNATGSSFWSGLPARRSTSANSSSGVDPAQLAFELNAVLVSASTTFVLQGDAAAFDRARAAVRRRLNGAVASS